MKTKLWFSVKVSRLFYYVLLDAAMMDVTKQSDLSGFYRNLLKQTVGEETSSSQQKDSVKVEQLSKVEQPSEWSHQKFFFPFICARADSNLLLVYQTIVLILKNILFIANQNLRIQ